VSLGQAIEDIIENLCHQSFFADFTIRSPKYYKAGGLEKEAADLLVVFGNTLLAIQVKSRKVSSSNVQSQAESDRISRTVDKTVRQFRALFEALANSEFKSFVNGRGVEIPFNKNEIKEFAFIIIFAPVWGEAVSQPPRIRFDRTCYTGAPIAVHLFTLEQFSMLLTVLDTLPDFLLFLEARWILHQERLISADSDPLDEWALATFERKRLIKIIERRATTRYIRAVPATRGLHRAARTPGKTELLY